MNTKWRVYFSVSLMWLPFCALGQAIVKGKLLDSASRKPIPYATITLMDLKRNILANTFSNEEGFFSIQTTQKDSGLLEISSVGYASIVLPLKNHELGDIYLTTAGAGLAQVTVTAAKKLIDLRPGMLVYNAENDLGNKGGTAADVLRKTPILNVDAQGNVTMRGSANLKILVNGKYSGQIARSPADALNMMPAENIKSVEVITTPSAKYDAEGAAGVINIITKKGYKNINGALELSGGNMEQMFNPRIAITNDKWSFSVHGHLHRLRQKEGMLTSRTQFENGAPSLQLDQHLEKDNAAPHGSGDLAIVYTPDSATEISFGMNAWFGKWPGNSTINTMLRLPNGNIQEQYLQSSTAKEQYLGSDINLTLNRKLKKPGQEITLLMQFSPTTSKQPYQLLQRDIHDDPFYEEENNNKTRNREWTLQADYLHPLSKSLSLETGLKFISRDVRSDYSVMAGDPGMLQPVAARSNVFDYNQKVYAVYAMMKANLPKNWYAEGGVRYEHTAFEGKFIEPGSAFSNSFNNLIPTATLSRKLNEDQSISLSYTQRITRPYIWDLNPNADASDPKNITTGNPDLEPEIAQQAELTYGLNKGSGFFLNTALFWKKTDDAIVDFMQTTNEGISINSKQNLAGNTVIGLNFSSSITLSQAWSINGNINANYLKYNSDALQISREGWAADVDMNVTLKLPRQYSLQVFADYNSRAVTLQGYDGYNYYYAFAAKKSIPKKKLTITLSAINPFTAYIPQINIAGATGFYSSVENRFFNRAFKITFNWEFGGMFGERERRKINNDDVKDQFKG